MKKEILIKGRRKGVAELGGVLGRGDHHHHRQLREDGIEEGEVARHTIVKMVSQQQQ